MILIGVVCFELLGRLLGFTPARVRQLGVPPSREWGADQFGQGAISRGYFEAVEERGFDIKKTVKEMEFSFFEGQLRIFSNTLGCFDRNELVRDEYILLLGDSFTWGFNAYERKWGTRLESDLGVRVLKCGAPHAGQWHQLGKGKAIVHQVGRNPVTVVVGHFGFNDGLDDLLFPRSTVIDGYLVDQAAIDGHAVARLTRRALEARYEAWRKGDREAKNVRNTVRHPVVAFLRDYSLTANVVRRVLGYVLPDIRFGSHDVEAYPRWANVAAESNRQALLTMKSWCDEIGADLVVVLIPPKEAMKAGDPYGDTKAFLVGNGFRYVDLYPHLVRAYRSGRDPYWTRDPHWSPEGERIAAEVVAGFLKGR